MAVVVLAVVAMVVLVSVCICGVDVLVGCFNDGASFGDYGGGRCANIVNVHFVALLVLMVLLLLL